MCSRNPCGKKKIEFQKVVIPRGMINPHETTVIEIPTNLQKQPVVVAKRKTDSKPSSRTSSRSQSKTRYENFRPAETSSPINMYDPNNTTASRSYVRISQMDLKSPGDLEATERQEREQLQRDLDEFQRARRKLLANTSHLVNGEENKQSVRSARPKYF